MHMSIFKKNTTKKEIETSLNEIQINLENNYKDLAIKAFKDSSELVERYHNESLIDEKAYGKYKGQLDVFAKRMEMVGEGEGQKFVCVCGYKEKLSAFKQRKEKQGSGMSKKEVNRYLKKQQKEAEQPINNAFAEAFAKIKL